MVSVAEYICQHLKLHGVRHVFGVAGDFVLSFMDAVVNEGELDLIPCTNELNASYAADGYSRANRYSCLTVTFGCGELSAANGIGGANAEGIPMLVVAGRPASDSERIHHQASPDDVLASCKAIAEICGQQLIVTRNNIMEIVPFLEKAPFAKGPSYLSVPCSLFDCPFMPPPLVVPVPVDAIKKAAEDLTLIIKSGQRPLLILGQELNILLRSATGRYLTEWLEKLPKTTITLALGSAGLCHTEGWRSVGDHLHELSDFNPVIHIGWTMHDLSAGFGAVPLPDHEVSSSRITMYDGPPTLVSALRILEHAIRSQIENGLISEDLPSAFQPSQNTRLKKYPIQKVPLTAASVRDILELAIQAGDKLVRDTGRVTFDLGTLELPRHVPIFYQGFYASIGWSGGAALGVHLARTRWDSGRTLLIIGDGAFQMVSSEIANLARFSGIGAPLVYIVINNDGYLVERTIQDNMYNDIPQIDYTSLATAMGATTSRKVTTDEGLIKSLENISERGVHFIEVVLDKFDMIDPSKGWNMGAIIRQRNSYRP